MDCYVISFHGGKRYLRLNYVVGFAPQGWRPYIWTRHLEYAEKFDTRKGAEVFATRYLGGSFAVVNVGAACGQAPIA